MSKKIFAFAAVMTATLAAGAQPLELQGAGPYYRLTIPLSSYSQSKLPALGDLQVLNSANVAVPFAWIQDEAPKTFDLRKVPVFAIPESTAGGTSNIAADFVIAADGSIRLSARQSAAANRGSEWLLDTRNQLGPAGGTMVQLTLDIPSSLSGMFSVSVESSDDLIRWSGVGTGKLAQLTAGAERIEQFDVKIAPTTARFLRLRFVDAPQPFTLNGAHVAISQQARTVVPELKWTDAIKPTSCVEKYCDYAVPKNIPLDSLRVLLSDANTLANVTITGTPDLANFPTRHRHRNPLYLLRDKRVEPSSVAANDNAANLRWIARASVYRLQPTQSKDEITSPDIALDGSPFTRIRLSVDTDIKRLGATPPSIAIGSYSRTLIFLASGNPPFKLDWSSSVQSAMVPLTTLMPTYKEGQPITTGFATAVETVVAPSLTPATVAKPTEPPRTPFWLWGVLGVGILALGGMAFSLLRSMNKPR